MEEIEQVPNTYYYEKLYEDKHFSSFTENTQIAYQLGWQDNQRLANSMVGFTSKAMLRRSLKKH